MSRQELDMTDEEMEEYVEYQKKCIQEINEILFEIISKKNWDLEPVTYFLWMYGLEPYAEA